MFRSVPFSLALGVTLLSGMTYSAGTSILRSEPDARSLHGKSNLQNSYDYVIVGAGTSGLTVADRLSADGKCALSSTSAVSFSFLIVIITSNGSGYRKWPDWYVVYRTHVSQWQHANRHF